MSLSFDPEYLAAANGFFSGPNRSPKPALHDISSRRAVMSSLEPLLLSRPIPPDVTVTKHTHTLPDGHNPLVVAISKNQPNTSDSESTSAILHAHGGGLIGGSTAHTRHVMAIVSRTGVPFFSVEYRLAPESSCAGEDVYASLLWLRLHAAEFNIDIARIGVMGQSAGGALAASVALMARDRGLEPALAKQILIYPMLDDRNSVVKPALAAFPGYDHEDNITFWSAYIGREKAGNADVDVSCHFVPARAESLAGLPSTYIDAAGLDWLADDALAYTARLMKEGVDVEFHLFPRLPHGFDVATPKIEVTKQAETMRDKAILGI